MFRVDHWHLNRIFGFLLSVLYIFLVSMYNAQAKIWFKYLKSYIWTQTALVIWNNSTPLFQRCMNLLILSLCATVIKSKVIRGKEATRSSVYKYERSEINLRPRLSFNYTFVNKLKLPGIFSTKFNFKSLSIVFRSINTYCTALC